MKGAGRGNTAKSAAAYRDMFTSPVNRQLASGSIAHYEEVQERSGRVGLRRVGYLWLLRGEQIRKDREALEYLSSVGVVFDTMEPNELKRMLPGLEPDDIYKGVLGSRCGILNQNHLSSYYESEVERLGGGFSYGIEVAGFVTKDRGEIDGVRTTEREVRAGTTVIATGAWMKDTVASLDINVPLVPKKRQLFSVRAKGEELKRLLNAKGFNSHHLLPFTILPDGVYLRPAANSMIVGYSDEEREPELEERPQAERDFFDDRIVPQLTKYFPPFKGRGPEHSWAGHYAYHPPDNMPFVFRSKGSILAGGASGSGVMKADSIGRVAAGLYLDRKEVELGDGSYLKVAELGLDGRAHPVEEFVI